MAGLCLADSDRCFSSLSLNGKYSLIKRSRDLVTLPCRCTSTVFLLSLHKSFFQGFLSDLLEKANRHYDDQKLQEYTQTIVRLSIQETSLLMGLMLSHYQEWAESRINLLVQLPLSLKKKNNSRQSSQKNEPQHREKHCGNPILCQYI